MIEEDERKRQKLFQAIKTQRVEHKAADNIEGKLEKIRDMNDIMLDRKVSVYGIHSLHVWGFAIDS